MCVSTKSKMFCFQARTGNIPLVFLHFFNEEESMSEGCACVVLHTDVPNIPFVLHFEPICHAVLSSLHARRPKLVARRQQLTAFFAKNLEERKEVKKVTIQEN